jgi:riboflavin kinase/FMN adenylyltransferase
VSSRRFDGARSLGAKAHTTLVAIGNFDGVHAGHRAVICASALEARGRGLVPVVLTFDPHPAEVLGRGRLPVLTSVERKVELVCRLDSEIRVVVQPFTKELAASSPEQFAKDLLVAQLGAEVVIVGQNFRFGHNREGTLDTLVRLGRELHFEARAEQLAGDSAGTYSSTRARALLSKGDLAGVEHVLGRPHSISGLVVQGDQRGRTLGFPTANLANMVEELPPHGVYACVVDELDDTGRGKALAKGVANLGVRPTVQAGQSFEVHLFDFAGDLYGRRLRVHLIARLRGEQRFPDLSALKAQIARDSADARVLVDARTPDPEARGGWY